MPRMIDLIRQSAVPSNLMQFAAKGALLVPNEEMIEILAHLATKNKVFGEQARLTLAGWDVAATCAVASSATTPKAVLDYFIDPENLRPALLPLLLENPAVEEPRLVRLSIAATREQVEIFLQSERVNGSREVLSALLANARLRTDEVGAVKEKLSALPGEGESAQTGVSNPQSGSVESSSDGDSDEDDEVLNAFMAEHAAEIAAENEKNFQPASFADERTAAEAEEVHAESVTATSTAGAAAAPARKAVSKKWILSAEEQRGSALQKIAKLDVKGRINLAVKGSKEERSILIRDGTKIVALAVLESPKVTDGEVEKFASQKNVLEAVLRAIPMKRRFMKLYPVVRNLTFNPRTPIDVSLGLMKNLLTQDLRHLAGNKEVSDTVRKLALKMFRQKLDVTKKS